MEHGAWRKSSHSGYSAVRRLATPQRTRRTKGAGGSVRTDTHRARQDRHVANVGVDSPANIFYGSNCLKAMGTCFFSMDAFVFFFQMRCVYIFLMNIILFCQGWHGGERPLCLCCECMPQTLRHVQRKKYNQRHFNENVKISIELGSPFPFPPPSWRAVSRTGAVGRPWRLALTISRQAHRRYHKADRMRFLVVCAVGRETKTGRSACQIRNGRFPFRKEFHKL